MGVKNSNSIVQERVYNLFNAFLYYHLAERDYEKVVSMLDDNIFGIGIGNETIAVGKEQFTELLRIELGMFPDKIPYSIEEFHEKQRSENSWDVFAKVQLVLHNANKEKLVCRISFSGSFELQGDTGLVTMCHISENVSAEKENSISLAFLSRDNSIDMVKTEQAVVDIVMQSMPGGIIAGYVTEGFPISFVNEKYLKLLGYSSFEEYVEEVHGMAIESIHPEDRERVMDAVLNSYSSDEQYGIEYRLRQKNGNYIFVYDVGKKIIMPDQREVIVCVLVDMTETVKLRNMLAQESSCDELTGIFNRRGGIRAMEKYLVEGTPYTFALLDIDNLKQINDKYNHQAGDHALKTFSDLMKETFTERTTIARLGGDEFIAFFPRKMRRKRLEEVFGKLQAEYCSFIQEHYPESHSSASVGCVMGTKSVTFDTLYQMADELMYRIKKDRKNGCNIKELDEEL